MVWVLVAIAIAIVVAPPLISRSARRREEERAEEYRKAALLRGWQFEMNPTHFVYSGRTEGFSWTYEAPRYLSRRSGQRHPSQWSTENVRSEDLIIVWPERRFAAEPRHVDLPEAIRNLMFRPLAALLEVPVELLADAKSDPAIAAAVSDEDIVAVVLWRKGLRILTTAAASTPADVEKILRLGLNVARARERNASSPC